MNRIAIAGLAGLAALLSMGRADADKAKKAVPLPTPVPVARRRPPPAPPRRASRSDRPARRPTTRCPATDITTDLQVHHSSPHRQ